MDTSRGPAWPIDSRPDRRFRPIQGRHIMRWRQMWRQRWRPTRTPSPSIATTRDRQGQSECPVDGRLGRSTAGDHVLTHDRLRVPSRAGALRPVVQPSHVLFGWHEGSVRYRVSVWSCAPLKWWRPPAWRLGASGGRQLRASPISGFAISSTAPYLAHHQEVEAMIPCMPLMHGEFTTPRRTSRPHTAAQVRGTVEDRGVGRSDVARGVVSANFWHGPVWVALWEPRTDPVTTDIAMTPAAEG